MITARIEFTDHETGRVQVVEVSWEELVLARSASAEAWNASNRLCIGTPNACDFGKARQKLNDYREHHEALRKVLGLKE